MLTETEKLDRLTELGIELNQINDLDILMENVLTEARNFSNADAGSIYIRDGEKLLFSYTQNDTLQKRLPPGEKLIYSTFSIPIDRKSIAGFVAASGDALNIPDVYGIDPSASYSFSKDFDKASGYTTRTMLTIPLKTSIGQISGILQMINAQDEEGFVIPFSAAGEKVMRHFASVAAVALERAKMTRAILLRMIRMAEMRDPKETGAHVNRVAGFALEIYERWARRHGIPKKEIQKKRDSFRMAAMLHDVGKVAISDMILKKPARFSEDEFEIMKQHTVMGAQLFLDRQSDFDAAAAEVALNHHERWDGGGYPGHVDVASMEPLPGHVLPNGKAAGKREEETPLFGRIVAIADVFDALSSKRVYKDAWDESNVLALIEKERGAQFDPELVDIFFSCLDVLRSIQQRYQDGVSSH